LRFSKPYDAGFELLRSRYLLAVEMLKPSPSQERHTLPHQDTSLAEHIMVFYWRGKIDFGQTDSLLERFFDMASQELRADTIGFIGRAAMNFEGDIPEETMERLTTLWEKRMSSIEESGDVNDHRKELEAFGWWFRSPLFDVEWGVNQLLLILSVEKMTLQTDIEANLRNLCAEALASLPESEHPSLVFTQAPEGEVIANGATTITLGAAGASLFRSIVSVLRGDPEIRIRLGEREIQNEVKVALFDGAEALEQNKLDARALVEALFNRINSGQENWVVYLPIESLELPEAESIELAGGIFKKLSYDEKQSLQNQGAIQANASKFTSETNRVSGVNEITKHLEDTLDSSSYWYVIQVNSRSQSAKDLAIEAAMLGLDILLFWGLLNGIDPETSSLGSGKARATSRSFQFVKDQCLQLDIEAPPIFPYKLTKSAFSRLLSLPEFRACQTMSNEELPTEVQGKFLLSIQQYAEAARLPSPTLKLVWYLSAMETILASEAEGSRHVKVSRRIQQLLGQTQSALVTPLYAKRRRPVHYGQRNRVREDLVTDVDLQTAKTLAYLAIVSALGKTGGFTQHTDFLRHLETI